jgi:hypothetical protein
LGPIPLEYGRSALTAIPTDSPVVRPGGELVPWADPPAADHPMQHERSPPMNSSVAWRLVTMPMALPSRGTRGGPASSSRPRGVELLQPRPGERRRSGGPWEGSRRPARSTSRTSRHASAVEGSCSAGPRRSKGTRAPTSGRAAPAVEVVGSGLLTPRAPFRPPRMLPTRIPGRRPTVVTTSPRCGCRSARTLQWQPAAIGDKRWPRCYGRAWG